MKHVAKPFRNLGRGLRGVPVDRYPQVHPGQILAVSRGGGGWCATVGTPYGTFLTGKPCETFLRGDCLSIASWGEGIYHSRQEPSAPHEYEALRWGVGKMVELATGKGRDLDLWEAPGLLYEGFWGKEYLVLYWKCGESDFLELWTPEEFLRLEREKDPEPWWYLYAALLRNSYPMKGLLKEPYIAYEDLLSLLSLLPARAIGRGK